MSTTKKLTSSGAVSAVPSGNAILTTDANGAIKPVTIAALQNAVMNNVPPACMLDGVFIMYHRKSDNLSLMLKPHKWASLQNAGEIADGVVIVEGGKVLVVAPTEADSAGLLWSSAAVSGGAATHIDRLTAMTDWNGKANTDEIISKSTSTAVTDTDAYAPGFCNLYSHGGLGAGKWWLPSVSEMMMVYANITKINYCLRLINGATQLSESGYWTSTEYSASYAWRLHLGDGYLHWYPKTVTKGRVRPVSAFIE